jgi:predicted nuclease of predicted toxin-antitoxin system
VKLLFDQNISYRVVKKIEGGYPGSDQVKKMGLENSTDLQIWEFARKNGYAIVPFDSNFMDIANLKGHPPKIIWLRTGNTKTDSIANLLLGKGDQVTDFLNNPGNRDWACLEIE